MSCLSEQKAKKIQLKNVGSHNNMVAKSERQHNFQWKTQRQKYYYNGEIQLPSTKPFRQKNRKQSQIKGRFKFNLIQDPRESEFTYRKYVFQEKILLILSVFHILLCMIRTQINENNEDQLNSNDARILVVINMLSLATMISVFLKSIYFNQFRIDQKKYYCVRYKTGFLQEAKRFLQQKKFVLGLIIQFCIIGQQPFLFTQGCKFQTFDSYNQIFIKHDLNDGLCLLSMFRVYIFIGSLINISIYSTPRSIRLCNYNRADHSFLYSLKCLIKQYPLRTIFAVFLIQQVVLGYCMRISQGQITKYNPQIPPTGFENYINCFWCIFITMATVGYGDYFPKTFPGRTVAFLAATSGIIVSSLLIVSLKAYLTMQTNEIKAHLTLIRLQYQNRLKQQATQALIQAMKLSNYLSNHQSTNNIRQTKEVFIKLKHKIDVVKYSSRKVKSIVNNSNILQQMSKLFQLLKQSLNQLFQNQLFLRSDLLRIKNSRGQNIDKKKLIRTILVPPKLGQGLNQSSQQ